MSVPVTSDLNINKVGKPLVANRRVFSFLKSVYNFVEIIYISHVPHVLGGNWGFHENDVTTGYRLTQ